MNRFLLVVTMLVAMLSAECRAQSVVLGEKIPKLQLSRWLMDLQPEATDYTCLMFLHSESELCHSALRRVVPLVEQYGQRLNLVIITNESYDSAGVALTSLLDDRVGVAFDESGKTFRTLEVNFIPFCVVCDKRRRVVWCGHGATLTTNVMDKILTPQQ